jgi:hypothetical protein
MINLQKAQEQWGTLKVQRAAKAYEAAMRPDNDVLAEFPAQKAALMVIGVSIAFAAGKTSQQDVASTLRLASGISCIPVEAWKALSELKICLFQLQDAECSVIAGGKK